MAGKLFADVATEAGPQGSKRTQNVVHRGMSGALPHLRVTGSLLVNSCFLGSSSRASKSGRTLEWAFNNVGTLIVRLLALHCIPDDRAQRMKNIQMIICRREIFCVLTRCSLVSVSSVCVVVHLRQPKEILARRRLPFGASGTAVQLHSYLVSVLCRRNRDDSSVGKL
jgi:hypothetical protein